MIRVVTKMFKDWVIEESAAKCILGHVDSIPVKVSEVARSLGLEVKLATLDPRISGEIKKSSTSTAGYVIRVNRHEVFERQRFTIAHEIAHYLLHRDLIGDGIEDTILYRSDLSDRIEAEANRLAADLIMPDEMIRRHFNNLGGRKNEATLIQMARDFKVSEAAMRIRLGM
jgi:Zn-dependent peptidase ImmA (M78 family)